MVRGYFKKLKHSILVYGLITKLKAPAFTIQPFMAVLDLYPAHETFEMSINVELAESEYLWLQILTQRRKRYSLQRQGRAHANTKMRVKALDKAIHKACGLFLKAKRLHLASKIKKGIRFWIFKPGRSQKKATPLNNVGTTAVTKGSRKRKIQPHLTLLGLPREVRDEMYTYVFAGNGLAHIKQQLLGFPNQDYATYSHNFRILLTCQQIYAEALPLAYRLSCFYWFKTYSTNTLQHLCRRLNDLQAKNVRHIAFWSNPYLYEDFLDYLPSSLRLTKITICSNYMSGQIPQKTIQGRMDWIVKNIRNVKTLTRFEFFTGGGITGSGIMATNTANDCGFSGSLKATFEERAVGHGPHDGWDMSDFDRETAIARMVFYVDEGMSQPSRIVELKIGSVFERGLIMTE